MKNPIRYLTQITLSFILMGAGASMFADQSTPGAFQRQGGQTLPTVQAAKAGACGSNSSISAALDQCGAKGFISALCTKSGGVWSCLPSEDKTDPNVRPTGFTGTKGNILSKNVGGLKTQTAPQQTEHRVLLQLKNSAVLRDRVE